MLCLPPSPAADIERIRTAETAAATPAAGSYTPEMSHNQPLRLDRIFQIYDPPLFLSRFA